MLVADADPLHGAAAVILEGLLEGCQIIGFDWTYLAVNEVAARQGRRPREELLGRTMMQCYPGIEESPVFAELRRCMCERVSHRMENEFTFGDGAHRWFELRVEPVSMGLVILSLDITDRKRAEGDATRNAKTLHELLAAAPDGILLADERGEILLSNGAAEHIFGWDPGGLVGRGIGDLVPPLLRAAHARHCIDFLDHPRPRRMGEGRELLGQRRDGSVFPVEISLGAFAYDGRPTALAIVRDITERRELEASRDRADDARRRADETLRLLIDGASDYAMSVLDPHGVVSTWNVGAQRMSGYGADEIVGQTLDRFYAPEDVAAGVPSRLLERARSHGRAEDEGWRLRKDGSRFWANVVLTPLHDQATTLIGFAMITRDLTERRNLEEQVRQSQKLDAIGALAGGIAHDFNNLLSVILSYGDLLGAAFVAEDPLRRDLEEIKMAALRAADLTRQLLAFGRRQILQPKPVDLNDVVLRMKRMLRRVIGEDIELEFVACADLGVAILDRSQIDQVIVNLVVNARDAMESGGKLTIATANVELDAAAVANRVGVPPGRYVMLAVSDTGCGMDAQTLERIFEPFFTTKEHGRGTGLGLSTVFGIVRQSGGHIWAESEPGKGSVFEILFPRTDQAAVSEAQPAVATTRTGNETILVAEDEPSVRAVARMILERAGYRVLEGQSGDDAIAVCGRHDGAIDMLLTDVVMPRMSGRELAQRVTAMRPGVKVLFMSGYTEDAIVHHGVLDADVEFIAKPLTPSVLLQRVRELLDRPA